MFSSHEIEQRVIKIASTISGVPTDEIGSDSTFEELDLDSLARIEILVELERDLGIESEEEGDIQSIATIADAARMVGDLVTRQSAS